MPIVAAAAIGAIGTGLAANAASKGQKQAAQASQAATDAATAEQRRQYDLSRQDYAPYLQTGTAALGKLGALYGLGTGQSQAQAQTAQQPYYGGGVGGGSNRLAMLGVEGPMMQTLSAQGGAQPTIGTGQQGAAVQVPAGQSGGQFGDFWQSPDYQFRLNESLRALTARNAALGIQDSGAAQRSALTLAGNQASGEYNNYANRLAALAGVGQTAAQNNAALGQNYANNFSNLQTQNANNLASSYQNRAAIQGQLYQNLAGIGSGFFANR